MTLSEVSALTGQTVDRAAQDARRRHAAQEFETAFLAEMLKSTGVNAASGSFGGGAGEDAFASLLTQEYAAAMAAKGGIGVAEWVYQHLARQEGAADAPAT